MSSRDREARGRGGSGGFIVPHPAEDPHDARERDQVEDYATRKGWKLEEAERWLGPNLNYDPKRVADTAE